MRVLAVGDVVGKPGRAALHALLPQLVADEKIDFVVANAENVAGGLGTTAETARDLLEAGVHALTGGNHTWKHREFVATLERDERVLRPANYPRAPGRGAAIFTLADGRRVAVVNAIGRVFLEHVDDPFGAVDDAIAQLGGARVVLVDFHAEASSEKRAMGWHLDGRASFVWGTHTHVPTADEEVLPGGTAYVSDVGMTGAYASVIGLDPASCIDRLRTGRPSAFRPVDGNVQLRAVLADIDDETGRARSVRRIDRRLAP